MIVNSLEELEKELSKRINIALGVDVADIVRDVMTDHIVQDVYEAYEPIGYERRYNKNGLLDPNNIISIIDGYGGLSVQNITLGNPYYIRDGQSVKSKNSNLPITNVIETGEGYDTWKGSSPRPFMKNTHDDLKENHYHTKAMKSGLKKQGLEVV
jgi:hypothetical protein